MSQGSEDEKEEKGEIQTLEGVIPKWHLLGIGGCGCNIVDDVLVKRDLFKAEGVYSEIFEIGIASWWVLNTNIADIKIMDTIQKIGFKDAEIAERYVIAYDQHKWFGAGGEPELARKWMEHDRGEKSGIAGYKSRLDYVLNHHGKGRWNKPQAVLIVHGVGKGTGCGATPPLILALKELDPIMPIFAVSVFPFKEELEFGGGCAFDSVYGLSEVSGKADALMLVGNSQLEVLEGSPVPKEYATLTDAPNNIPKQIAASQFFRRYINPPILSFLETLTVPSIGRYPGLAVDIADIMQFLRNNSIHKEHGVIVPLYYESEQVDVPLEVLIENAIGFSGQLVHCKPETAIGAYIILVGNLPRFKYFKDIFKAPPMLFDRLKQITELQTRKKGFEPEIDIRVSFAVTNEKDRIRVLILLANPQIPILTEVCNKALRYINQKIRGKYLRPDKKAIFKNRILPVLEKISENTGTPLNTENTKHGIE